MINRRWKDFVEFLKIHHTANASHHAAWVVIALMHTRLIMVTGSCQKLIGLFDQGDLRTALF